MPFTLPPITRRTFLSRTALAAAGALFSRGAVAAEKPVDATRLALLSDTHVAGDASLVARGVNMADHLRRVLGEVTALSHRPVALLVNGDCAYLTGEAADYQTFTGLLEDARRAGIPVHVTLGNHDDRARIREAVAEARNDGAPVPDRLVAVLPGTKANWFLLDSLEFVNKTPGLLGGQQLAWLAAALDAASDKPAIVIGHHNLKTGAGEVKTELKDSAELIDVIAPRKHVKAYIFGHTHNWSVSTHESGIHLVNLPPTAYVFNAARPHGWVEAALRDDGMTLALHALDTAHPEHGQTKELVWRGDRLG